MFLRHFNGVFWGVNLFSRSNICLICLICPIDVNVEGARCFRTLEGVEESHELKLPFLIASIHVDLTGLKRD